ncbi:hypothetical protein [Cellulomonas sp. URHE0023]|uniref:hypothetical protein n=1 Tax=Cellulomonas sp. URHE0023 TaxID=1380354 RepID=UPI0004871470|nr:hypothetical protein [Cellulomonas sp. URHE0023]
MRRPLVLLVASACALVGLGLLAVAFIGIGTRTAQLSQTSDSPCMQALAAGQPGSHVRYSVFPPQSVCTFDVGGGSRSVVVAAASPTGARLGAALAVGGAAVCVGVLVAPRLRRA